MLHQPLAAKALAHALLELFVHHRKCRFFLHRGLFLHGEVYQPCTRVPQRGARTTESSYNWWPQHSFAEACFCRVRLPRRTGGQSLSVIPKAPEQTVRLLLLGVGAVVDAPL